MREGCRDGVTSTAAATGSCFLPPLSDNLPALAALQAGRLSVMGFGTVTVEPDIVEVSCLRCFTPAIMPGLSLAQAARSA